MREILLTLFLISAMWISREMQFTEEKEQWETKQKEFEKCLKTHQIIK